MTGPQAPGSGTDLISLRFCPRGDPAAPLGPPTETTGPAHMTNGTGTTGTGTALTGTARHRGRPRSVAAQRTHWSDRSCGRGRCRSSRRPGMPRPPDPARPCHGGRGLLCAGVRRNPGVAGRGPASGGGAGDNGPLGQAYSANTFTEERHGPTPAVRRGCGEPRSFADAATRLAHCCRSGAVLAEMWHSQRWTFVTGSGVFTDRRAERWPADSRGCCLETAAGAFQRPSRRGPLRGTHASSGKGSRSPVGLVSLGQAVSAAAVKRRSRHPSASE